MKELIQKQYDEHLEVVKSNPQLVDEITKIAELIIGVYRSGGRLYACGNGGSTCDAMHMVEELVAQYKNRRPAMSAHHLCDPSVITCWSNDEMYSDVFRRQVEAHGRKGDVLIGISTSGNSENVIKAIDEAKRIGMKTVSFLGKEGGKMLGMADAELLVKSKTTARIQEMHIMAIHSIIEAIDAEMHGV